jgi:hypothetical protein
MRRLSVTTAFRYDMLRRLLLDSVAPGVVSSWISRRSLAWISGWLMRWASVHSTQAAIYGTRACATISLSRRARRTSPSATRRSRSESTYGWTIPPRTLDRDCLRAAKRGRYSSACPAEIRRNALQLTSLDSTDGWTSRSMTVRVRRLFWLRGWVVAVPRAPRA